MSLASISNKNQTVEAFFDDFSLSDQRSGIHPSFSQKNLGSIGFENHALLGLHRLDNIKNRLKSMNEQVRGVDEKKMVRTPCCEKMGLKKGPWTPEEDQILISFVQQFGHGNWRALPKQAGLLRCGKSCRLRWINYLRPDIKRGNFTKDEEDTIIKLHQNLGNRWSTIAAKLPGRTDNEIKNYWHTCLKKRPNLSNYIQRHCSNETAMLQRDINHAKMSPNPGNFTTHQRIQSAPGNIQLVSPQKFQLDLPDSMEITTRRQVDTVGRVTEVSPGKVSENERKCSVARDGAITEAMKCDNSNDMEFWYNVLMKAGNSIEVQENLGSTSIVR